MGPSHQTPTAFVAVLVFVCAAVLGAADPAHGKDSASPAGIVNSPGAATKADSTSAWLAAITAANLNPNFRGADYAQPNRSVACPAGTYTWISDQLALPAGVGLSGNPASNANCYIAVKNASAAIQRSGAILIGDDTHMTFNQNVGNLYLEMLGNPGSGIVCKSCQNNTSISNVWVNQYSKGPAVYFKSVSASNNAFNLTNNQVSGFAGADPAQIGPLFRIETQTYPARIDNNGGYCYTMHCPRHMVEMTGGDISISSNWGLEDSRALHALADAPTGIYYDVAGEIVNIGTTTNNVDTSIDIENSSGTGCYAVIMGLKRIGGSHTIRNTSGHCGPAFTLNDYDVGLFVAGPRLYLDVDNLYALGNAEVSGVLRADSGFSANGAAGLTVTKTVKGRDCNDCVLVFKMGLLTSTTCP